MYQTGLAALLALTLSSPAQPAQRRDAPPNADEINDAISRSPEFRGTAITKLIGCVPSGSEDGLVDADHIEWYCIADGTPLPQDSPFIEIALRRQSGERRFDVLIGELAGVCPPAVKVADDLKRLSTRRGVSGLLTGRKTTAGSMTTGNGKDGAALLVCDYQGLIGENTYLLTVAMTYQGTRYHVVAKIAEELFDRQGNVLEQAQ